MKLKTISQIATLTIKYHFNIIFTYRIFCDAATLVHATLVQSFASRQILIYTALSAHVWNHVTTNGVGSECATNKHFFPFFFFDICSQLFL